MADNISFDDLIPSKQTDKSAPSKGADISFDDLIPKQEEARTSTTPLIEGKGGAAFGVYPKAGLIDQDPASRVAKHIGRTGLEAVVPTGAGLAGFGAGMAASMPAAAAAGTALAATGVGAPFAPVVAGAITLGGGFGGAMLASGSAKWLQDLMHRTYAPADYSLRQAERQAFPNTTFATELGVGMAGMSPRTAVAALSPTAGKFARLASTDTGQRLISGTMQGGIEAGSELATEGTVSPGKVIAATTAGALMPGFNVAGRIPFALGTKIGEKIGSKISTILPGGKDTTIKPDTDPLPPKPPEGSTPEEKAAYIQKLETIKAERDAKAPLTETAIRNKETGAIERMGPKHDEQRKLETADTHDQGFVDERSNFLTRQEAVDRAKNTEQLPKDYTPEVPEVGLRSEDLRKAGDKRFELTGPKTIVRKVELDDAVAPDTIYHGTISQNVEIDASGNLILRPSLNFGGKTSSVSFSHDSRVSDKYAGDTLTKSTAEVFDNPEALSQIKPVSIEISSDVLKNLSRENKEEWAVNTTEPIVIPKGKYVVKDVPPERLESSTKEYYSGKMEEREVPFTQKGGSSGEPSTTLGASVKSMLEKDKGAPVDRTKTDPRDVKDEKEFYEIATDIYEKYGDTDAVKFYEGYLKYKETWLEPIKETEKFVGINIKNKLANDRIIHNEMEKMMEAIPDPVRREAIAIAVDKGDLSGLTPKEIVVAKRYEELVKNIGDRAVEAGVVKGLLEDYVTHIIDWRGAPKGSREEFIQSLLGTGKRDPAMGGMTTESKFGKERKFKTFADLEWYIGEANSRIAAAGKSDWRLAIKTKDIAEIYKEYATSMEKAIENKNLVDSLKQVRNVNGESLIKEVDKENPMPYGWEMMDSPQFAGYAIHPDLKPVLQFVFDAGPGDLMAALGFVSQATKRIAVLGSFFHAKSLIEVLSSTGSAIPLLTPAKEIALGGVDKLLGTKYSGITKALDQFRNGGLGDNVDKWIKEGGLVLDVPEDVSKGLLSNMGKFADTMIAKYGPKTRVLESSLSFVERYTLGIFDKFTWDFLHTGGKIMVADAYLGRARMDAAKAGKPFDEVAARKEISSFVNDAFGGLNWFDAATQTQNEFAKRMAMAAYNPAGRRALQIILFAPDWTLSTIRAFTAALPKDLNPTKWQPVEGIKGMMTPTTKADYARLYQFKTAIAYVTLINGINLMVAGRPAWENKDPTRIEFPDGTSMQAMKHAMEPAHWIMDPTKTLANKLGFIPKSAIIGITGTEYASPQAPKLVDPSATGRAVAILKGVRPFQMSAYQEAPEGEGVKRALLGTLGFPLYGGTKEQKKEKRAERELILKENAWKYRDKEIEAGRELRTPKHDRDKKSLDKQRKEFNKKTGKE